MDRSATEIFDIKEKQVILSLAFYIVYYDVAKIISALTEGKILSFYII